MEKPGPIVFKVLYRNETTNKYAILVIQFNQPLPHYNLPRSPDIKRNKHNSNPHTFNGINNFTLHNRQFVATKIETNQIHFVSNNIYNIRIPDYVPASQMVFI
jgi:hypothetical protein